MYGLSLHIRQFLRRENATATMEFVITFPIIMILFIAVFETSMIMTRQVMMERTLDQAVRILRLANGLTVTPADIRTAICDNTSLLPDCDTLLTIDLREIDRATYTVPGDQEMCIERADSLGHAVQHVQPGLRQPADDGAGLHDHRPPAALLGLRAQPHP
jgi:hypothetical protein